MNSPSHSIVISPSLCAAALRKVVDLVSRCFFTVLQSDIKFATPCEEIDEAEEVAIHVVSSHWTGSAIPSEVIARIVRRFPKAIIHVWGCQPPNTEQLANDPRLLIRRLRNVAHHPAYHGVGSILLAATTPTTARPPDGLVPDFLLLRCSIELARYVMLKTTMDRNAFDQETDIEAVTDTLRRDMSNKGDTIDLLEKRLPGIELHDLRATCRSIVHYAACFLAAGHSRVSPDEARRGLARSINADIPLVYWNETIREATRQWKSMSGKRKRMEPLCNTLAGQHMLLVDDKPEGWKGVFGNLLGATVTVATSVADAKRCLRGHVRFDAILLDLYLDGSGRPDGLSLLEHLRTVGNPPPVVGFSTTQQFDLSQEFASREGCCGLIQKSMETLSLPIFEKACHALDKAFASRTRTIRYANSSQIAARLRSLQERFHEYDFVEITHDRMLQFLRQLSSPREVELTLDLLDHVYFLNRRQVTGAAYEILKKAIPNCQKGCSVIVCLGDVFDSDKLLGYDMGTFLQSKEYSSIPRANSIAEALRIVAMSKGRLHRLVAFDDILQLGNTLCDIYGRLLDKTSQVDLHDQSRLIRPLSTAEQRRLRRCTVVHCHIVAFEEGVRHVREFLDKNRIRKAEFLHGRLIRESESCFDLAAGVFRDEEQAAEARNLFYQIGKSLMKGRRKCDERALGYGNSGKLIVFYYNVPTGTVTALWKRGQYNGRPWMPLFERRHKK